MNAIFTQRRNVSNRLSATVFVARVRGSDCPIRCIPLTPIHELLGFENETESALADLADGDLVADVLDSRMIAPPRPRRRRDRSVSSRAAFYAPVG